MDLFDHKPERKKKKFAPLADRLRPETLDEFVGQKHILGQGKMLRRAILEDKVGSMILWGPPGSGKTTLARIIANMTKSNFISFSAVTSGIKEIKDVIFQAGKELEKYNKKTIIFIDEIHRFNRAQQDAFLPHVEDGTITLIGATTENPSFEVNSPLLSRTKVYLLYQLAEEELAIILRRVIEDEKGLKIYNPEIKEEALQFIISNCQGDARICLNTLETAVISCMPDEQGKRIITRELASEAMQKKALAYDKNREEHYNIISAFHKSLRGSDPDASLYWLARMLEAGEDPLYIARRMVRFASEDVGNADPQALQIATAAKDAVDFIGMPEGDLSLAQAAIYLACAPKSNAVYKAYLSAKADVQAKGAIPVPLHIRNPVTNLMKEVGYGKDYKYAHKYEDAIVEQDYMPAELKGRVYYNPTDRGFEEEIKKRLEKWKELRKGKK